MKDNLMKESLIKNGSLKSDDLFVKLLSYHVQLIDDVFVESVMKKIDSAFKFRQWVLSIFTVLGCIGGLIGLSMLWGSSKAVFESVLLSGYSLLFFTLIVVAVVVFFTWVLNEEFETP